MSKIDRWDIAEGIEDGIVYRPDTGALVEYVDHVARIEAAKATIAQQAQMIEHLRGGPTPLFTGVDMADSSADGRRSLAEYLIKQIAIEHPDQDTLLTVKYIAQWIALETGL